MECSTTVEGKITVLTLQGDIDLESSPELREVLKKISTSHCPSLLIDFAQVSYIDSSGLATIIEYFQAAQAYKGKLAICSLGPRIKNSFSIVRLDEIFSIYPDAAAARAVLMAS